MTVHSPASISNQQSNDAVTEAPSQESAGLDPSKLDSAQPLTPALAQVDSQAVVVVSADSLADYRSGTDAGGLELAAFVVAMVAVAIAGIAAFFAGQSAKAARDANNIMVRSEEARSRPWVFIDDVLTQAAYIERTAENIFDATFAAKVSIWNNGGFLAFKVRADTKINGRISMHHGLRESQMLAPNARAKEALIGYSRLDRQPRPDEFTMQADIYYTPPGRDEEYLSSHIWIIGPQPDEADIQVGERRNLSISYKGVDQLT